MRMASVSKLEYLLHVGNAFDAQRFEDEHDGLDDVVVMLLQ